MFVHETGVACGIIFESVVMIINRTTPVTVDHGINSLVLLYLLSLPQIQKWQHK